MATFNGLLKATTDSCNVKWIVSAWDLRTDTGGGNVGQNGASRVDMGMGMLFRNITIPKGSLITTAVLEFEADASLSGAVVNTRFTGEKNSNPVTFNTLANYQARRGTVVDGANNDNITTAQVDWNSVPAFTAGETYQSPELKTIIQELIDQDGWRSNNRMVIFWDDHDGRSSDGDGKFRSLDWGATGYYALIITWGPKFPTSDVARVTGIRRIYRPGVYRMLLSLGEISDMDDIAGHRDYERFRHWWSFEPEEPPPDYKGDYPYPGDDPEKQWPWPTGASRARQEPEDRPDIPIPRGPGGVLYPGDDPEKQPLWKPTQPQRRTRLPFPAPPPSFAPRVILDAPKVFKETVIDPIIDFVRSFFARDW